MVDGVSPLIVPQKVDGEGYVLSLPQIVWSYQATSRALCSSRLMYRVLREWNLAHRHGLNIREVLYHGERLTDRQVELCNLWTEAGGAAQAQKMEHWEAVRLFERIILGGRKPSGIGSGT